MNDSHRKLIVLRSITVIGVLTLLFSCSFTENFDSAISVDDLPKGEIDFDYRIAPGDRLDIFVWRNKEISSTGIPVRPDGKISAPLITNLAASGKTPSELANDIEEILAEYIRDPFVTVTVMGITGEYAQQVRVVGEAANPIAIPYSKNMTLLDVMIRVGGLTEFAAGNKSTLVRNIDGQEKAIRVKLDDLINGGEIAQNIQILPGDILIIPESMF